MQIPDKKALDLAISSVKTGYADVAVNKTAPVLIAEHQEYYIDDVLNAARTLSALYDAIGEDAVRGLLEGTDVVVPWYTIENEIKK